MFFDNVVGQHRAKGILKRALENDRLAHTLLLHGPEGVGKSVMALELAKAVNCLRSQVDPCDECRSCRKILSINHPDLKILFPLPPRMKPEEERSLLLEIAKSPYSFPAPARNAVISIDRVRELQKEFSYGVYEAKWKVGIIFEADRMRPEAANALLKTLEEPPRSALLILTTARPDFLLPTVLSRCQRVRLGALSGKEVQGALVERKGLSPEKAGLISKACGGSLKEAYLMVDEDVDKLRDEVCDFLGVALWGEGLEALRLIENLAAQRDLEFAEKFLQMLFLWLRDIFLYTQGHTAQMTNFDRPGDVERLARAFDLDEVERMADRIESCLEMMSRNVNLQLILIGLWQQMRWGVESKE